MPVEHHWYDWWSSMMPHRPTRLYNQHFGQGLTKDDLHLSPIIHRQSSAPVSPYDYYLRPWRVDNTDTGSTIYYDKDRYLVNLDVQQFSPEEVQVKVVNHCIMVEGKHEEKEDEHGHISRHFMRRYCMPKEYNPDAVVTSLSSDGVLTISAPKVDAVEAAEEKVLPITQTGPHKAVQVNKKEEENKK